MEKFKKKKQFRHKAEIPLTVLSVILSFALAYLLVFLLTQIPENPDIKKVITDFFGINKDTVDALVHFGIYAIDIVCIVIIIHIVFSYIRAMGKCRGYDIKPDNIQMKDIKDIVDDFKNKLNIKWNVEIYFFHGGKGEIKAMGVLFKSPYVIRLSSNYVKHFYNIDKYQPALKFIIAKEIAHIYLGHANIFWTLFTFIARMIPIYGNLFNRVINYSADKVAAELLEDQASDALVMSVLNPKTIKVLKIDDLFRYKREQQSKWAETSFHYSLLFCDEAPPFYRLEAIEKGKSGRLF